MEKFSYWSEIAEKYIDKFIDYLPTLIGALAVLFIGLWGIKIITKYVEKFFQKKDYDVTLEKFIANLIKWSLRVILFVVVITQLGIESATLVGAIGGSVLAIGLALQGSLANFAGGVLIIMLKPFKVGDWIAAQGIEGTVREVSLFYTKIDTFGNQRAVIPNGKLSNDNIVNYSFNGLRRNNLIFGIGYEDDIKLARKVIAEVLSEQKGIVKDPAPQIFVAELADSSVNFSVRYFAPLDVYWDIHFTVIEETKTRLEAAGISIPFPQRDVHLFEQNKG